MVDCLIIVERNVFKPDIIHRMLQQGMETFFDALAGDNAPVDPALLKPSLSYLPNYGMAGTISLTSVVLATALIEAGLSCAVLDDDDILGTYADKLPELIGRARVVAVSTTFIVSKQSLRNIVQTVRQAAPDTPLLLGGQGIPSLALDPLSGEDADIFGQVDAVMYGEAEDVFPRLVKDFRDGVSHLADLPGVLYRRRGRWEGSQQPVTVDLDAVAIPDWGVLEKVDINAGRLGEALRPSSGSLEEGRGCRFGCRFCSYHLYSAFRRKSPARIVAELKSIKALGYDTAAFVGAEFYSPAQHSAQVLEAMAQARLGINSWIYGRLDYLARHPELLEKTVAAGVSNIVFGMESGDPGILKNMGKHYDVAKMIEGTLEARRRGLTITASLIIGFPGETEATLANTARAVAGADFNYLFLHALNVVPFTPLWRLREQMGLKINKTGFWAHPTMTLAEVPAVARNIIRQTNRDSSSLFVNVKRNLAAPFLAPGEQGDLDKLTKVVQDVLDNEWAPEPDPAKRGELWRRVQGLAGQLPDYAFKRLQNPLSEG